MKLNRAQEEILIKIGLEALLNRVDTPVVKPTVKTAPKRKKRQWSPEQRQKFQATMRKVWAKKRKELPNK
jgi:hypothetical protein